MHTCCRSMVPFPSSSRASNLRSTSCCSASKTFSFSLFSAYFFPCADGKHGEWAMPQISRHKTAVLQGWWQDGPMIDVQREFSEDYFEYRRMQANVRAAKYSHEKMKHTPYVIFNWRSRLPLCDSDISGIVSELRWGVERERPNRR